MQRFFEWMLDNGRYFLLLSVGMALFRFRYLRGPLRWVGFYLLLACLGEVASDITAHVLHVPNLYLLHIYTVLEFNLIALFYVVFFGHFYPRSLMLSLMFAFTLLAILNSLFVQPITSFNTYARALESILIIGLTLLCFYKILIELVTKRLDKHPVFWINTGFLLYFAGNLFLFVLSNALLKNPNPALSYLPWGLHALLMVWMHLLISVGLWFSPRLR
jgi:hypothetical protein